jgi:hypothetical protein
VSGRTSEPLPNWTGRWAIGGTPCLDDRCDAGNVSRDDSTSDDLDALATLEVGLHAAVNSGSWSAVRDAQLLAGLDEESLQLERREFVLRDNLSSIAEVCERFVTRLGELVELRPVAQVKRPARKALARLAAHTEDWAARTLSGPIPRRALAVSRDEDADLYENRMVVELVHPILTSAISARVQRLRRIRADLADLERARDEGTHRRRERLYRFWGGDAARVGESSDRAARTLEELERLGARLQHLRGSTLGRLLRGRRTGQRTLRHTNLIANDRHYRAAGLVWSAFERDPDLQEDAEERRERLRRRHLTFDQYALGLLVRAFSELGYSPDGDTIPTPDHPGTLTGAWGTATIRMNNDGTLTLESHGTATRFVPLIDLVGPDDDPATVEARWQSVIGAVAKPTVIIHLSSSETLRALPPRLATPLISAAQDDIAGRRDATAIPVSPLETTSLERVARAVATAVMVPALLSYPLAVSLDGRPVPRRLIDRLMTLDSPRPAASPIFHRPSHDELHLRRPMIASESTQLDALLRELSRRAKAPGWERDMADEIWCLRAALDIAESAARTFLTCPGCRNAAGPEQLHREADVFSITCRLCGTRWGHERCGACQARVPIIELEREPLNPEVQGPGWVERIFGHEALASPCWARTVGDRYICTSCGKCPLSGSEPGANCTRCDNRSGVLHTTP